MLFIQLYVKYIPHRVVRGGTSSPIININWGDVMLQFLVLGQVPGTHLQINFSGVLIVTATLLATYEFSRVFRRHMERSDESSLHTKDA